MRRMTGPWRVVAVALSVGVAVVALAPMFLGASDVTPVATDQDEGWDLQADPAPRPLVIADHVAAILPVPIQVPPAARWLGVPAGPSTLLPRMLFGCPLDLARGPPIRSSPFLVV